MSLGFQTVRRDALSRSAHSTGRMGTTDLLAESSVSRELGGFCEEQGWST